MEQFQNQGCGNQAGFPNVPPTPYMGFVDAIKVCFNKYATFTGRASRAEYWWWVLFTFVVGALCSMFGHVGQYISGVASLAFLVPSLAVAWRRMHDIGKGGGWYFIILIPIVGWILWIVWCCKPSEPCPNRFGDVPAC
jgi:hypothetical protein